MTLIYHFAASVKFTEKYKSAIDVNVRGTREMLKLASDCKNLQLFCHLSTAFVNLDQKILKDELYESQICPNLAIQLTDSCNEKVTENIFSSIPFNNVCSYTFTKSLAETLVFEFSEKLKIPAIICRPAYVTPSESEPSSGCSIGSSGINGLFIAATFGIFRTVKSDTFLPQMIPVDHVINDVMLSTWNYLENG